MLLHHLLERSAARLPNQEALVVDGQRWSYADINRQADCLAAALQHRGVQAGDRVATFLDNSVQAVISLWATLKCGAVLMPINPLTKRDKLAYLLNDARASVLIAHAALLPEALAALAQNTSVHTAWVVGAHRAAEGLDSRCAALPDLDTDGAKPQAEHVVELPAVQVIDQDLAAIIYTSGSTAEPKGVMLSHLNMRSAARSVSSYLQLQPSDRILCALPLAFDYGLYQLLMAARVGAAVVLERSFAFPVKVLEVMARERVTVLPGVPTMFALLMNLKLPEAFNLPDLRLITNTAAALSEHHIQQLRALFPQATLFSMYGLTECKRVTYLPPDQLDIRPTSVGRGMPNEELWLIDAAGQRLPNGATGELVIRGSHVMRGYWEKPLATAERLKVDARSGQVVLHSGDIFRSDAQGYLYFVARKDDIIKSRGEKVSPREVENVLYALEGVLEAAVVGVPDALLGEAVKAVVSLKTGAVLTEREVIRHCQARLESFMVPKTVIFVDELPKTDTGKIKKTGLR